MGPEAHGSTRTRARNIRRRRVAARQRASIHSTSISNTTAGTVLAAPASDPLCASYDTNRLLRMLAVRAFFEEGGLGHFEGLLRSTWHFLDVPLMWQVERWELDGLQRRHSASTATCKRCCPDRSYDLITYLVLPS